MSASDRDLLVTGLGVFGGLLFGFYAVKHLFVVGLTPEERSGMFKLAAGSAIYIGLTQLVEPQYQQYLDPLHLMSPEIP